FGNLLAGFLADRIGAPNTLIIGGSFCILASIVFTRQLPKIRQAARPVYQKIGLLPKTNS
ncbi:MAG TPA: MFS transporter, partial [Cyanobacteria bacterium UBA11049]|nr:MFS transporter [Cyanobacteria bacterium UBA11049]